MIIVERGSAGDDHSPEAVEIEEHRPLKFQLYNTQHTHKLCCDVNNTGQYMCIGCPMAHKISSNNHIIVH